jgi:hypothetical protein
LLQGQRKIAQFLCQCIASCWILLAGALA